jgi:class 3 adenylate cyclase
LGFCVVSVGDATSPACLALGRQQQQTANCQVRYQEGRGKEGSGVTHPGAVSQFPRGRRGDKTPPHSTIAVAIRHPQRFAGLPKENPALQAVLMALEMREAIGALTETWRRWGHDIGFGIGIAHGFATLGTIGFEGRFDYAAIGTVSNVASRLCDEATPGQILISPRVLMKIDNAVKASR